MGDKEKFLRVEVVDGHVEDLVVQVARFALIHLLNYEEEVRFDDWFLGKLRSLLYIFVNLLYYLFNLDRRRKFYFLILLFLDVFLLQGLRDNTDLSLPIDLDSDIADNRSLTGKDIHVV